jgi:hypothetical protein
MKWKKNQRILFRQQEGVNISANAVHPGVIATSLFRNRSIVNGIISNLTGKFII